MPETPEKAKMDATTASPKSSPSKKEIDAATMALNHFAQGKRHLVVGDIQSAVNSLQEACKLLADQYGETAPECGDAYFCYGKALLEMARMESGVIGNALDGVPEGDDAETSQVENPEKLTDTEKNEVTELVDKALEENFEGLEKKKKEELEKASGKVNGTKEDEKVNGVKKDEMVNGAKEDEKVNGADTNGEVKNGEVDSEKMETSQDEEVNEAKPSESAASTEEGKSEKQEGSTENEDDDSEADAESQDGESQDGEGSQDDETKEGEEGKEEEKDEVEGDKTEDDEEEVTNLQLSWEMLELAKVIFQKQEDTNPKMKGKVAEVYLKLGEVGLESENYAQGIEDFKQCLEIQKKALDSDDRCLAETHYQLGIAYSFGDEFDLAIESFNSAVNVIETRIANLNKIMKEKLNWTEEQKKQEAATKVDPFYTEEGEIDELNKLLPEMKEKIVDMEQMKKDSKERIKAAKEAMLSGVLSGESSSNPFGASSSTSSAFGAPSTSSSSSSSSKEAKPIMVVRKKRKLEEEGGGDLSKKIKGEKSESQAAVNGSEMANGQTENNTEGKEELKSSAAATDEEKKDATLAIKKVELKSVS